MSARPWMPLYIADYRADTAHLSAAEHGAYLLLIMHYWQTGGLPDGDVPLARIACMTPTEWKKARPIIEAFFDCNWKHKRIDAELARATEVSIKRKASAEQRWSKSNANALQKDTQSQSHTQREKEDAPSGASSKVYFFESGVIRLSEKDFRKWADAFSSLELKAELLALTQWAETQGKDWFFAVSGALAKRNRTILEARKKPEKPATRQQELYREGMV